VVASRRKASFERDQVQSVGVQEDLQCRSDDPSQSIDRHTCQSHTTFARSSALGSLRWRWRQHASPSPCWLGNQALLAAGWIVYALARRPLRANVPPGRTAPWNDALIGFAHAARRRTLQRMRNIGPAVQGHNLPGRHVSTDDVAPSTGPRGWYGHDHQGFAEFRRRHPADLPGSMRHDPARRLREAMAHRDHRADELRQPPAGGLRRRDLRCVSS
jgi:hypothetical protein